MKLTGHRGRGRSGRRRGGCGRRSCCGRRGRWGLYFLTLKFFNKTIF